MADEPIALTAAAEPGRLDTLYRLATTEIRRRQTFIRFAMVGAIGYVIYTGLLFFMYDLSPFGFLPEKRHSVRLLFFNHSDSLLLITTLVGTQASIVGVFAGHCLWTFSDRATVKKPLWLRFVQFQGRALVSTLGILTVAVNGVAVGLGVHPFIAVPVGLVASFTWNWLCDTRIIWRRRSLP